MYNITYNQYKALINELGIDYNYRLMCGLSGGMVGKDFLDSVTDSNPIFFKDRQSSKFTMADFMNISML